MVCASMDVGIHNVSIHGWANLHLFLLPYLLKFLSQATYPTDPRLWKTTYNAFVQGSSWHWLLQGR
jgi:hypothetical protein